MQQDSMEQQLKIGDRIRICSGPYALHEGTVICGEHSASDEESDRLWRIRIDGPSGRLKDIVFRRQLIEKIGDRQMKPKDNLAPMDLEAQLAASLKALPSCDWCGKPVGLYKRHLICKRSDLNGRTEWQITSDMDLEVRHHPCDSMIRIKGGTSTVFLSLYEISKLRDVLAIIIEDQRRFDEEKIKRNPV